MEAISYKVLIICTSNKDRSPALEAYFKEVYPLHEYRSAGINKHFCQKNGTHYLEQEDVDWSNLILFAEDIHREVFKSRFHDLSVDYGADAHKDSFLATHNGLSKGWRILNCGKYEKGCIGEDYLTKADLIFQQAIN
jgi:predicted protein tyrosine phosphatase